MEGRPRVLCCCCVQSAAYEEPVKFPTKAGSWQTVWNSSVWFLSVLHPSAQTTGGGGEVDGCTHGGKWPSPHTADLVHRVLYSGLKEVMLPGVVRVSVAEGRALRVDFRAASCLLDLQHS